MKNLDRIQTFSKLAEGMSFTQAADFFGISTAATSKQIANLEAELGLKLLDRSTRKTSLTEAGRDYYLHCRELLEKINELDLFASKLKTTPAGELRIVSNPHFGEQSIIPFLKAFLEKYPAISMNLELAERFPDMDNENIDLVFGVSVIGPEHLIQKTIANTRYVVAGSPEYFKKHGTPQKPKDLIHHQYITHSMRVPNDRIQFKDGYEVQVKPIIRLNDTRAMLSCALNGMGLIRVHDYVAKDSLLKQNLIEVLQEYAPTKQPIYLYYKPTRFLAPKIRAFMEFFLTNPLKHSLD